MDRSAFRSNFPGVKKDGGPFWGCFVFPPRETRNLTAADSGSQGLFRDSTLETSRVTYSIADSASVRTEESRLSSWMRPRQAGRTVRLARRSRK